ncbi:MAG: AAA family ATPase [Clostridia bacterium]|nr:AAA family ATPase [Clostridia bacterium]
MEKLMEELFVNRIKLNKENINSKKYPFNIPCLVNFDELKLDTPVTLFYGENGAGKSTLVEAIAIALGLNPEGGSNNMQFSSYDDYSELYKHLTISKFGVPKTKFFLRAESFYNVATNISNNSDLVDTTYGGEDLHSCSHGESFLKLVEHRFWDKGLYILDEPEAALSPSRQMTLLCYIHNLAQNGSQFIIATHSPILLAYRYGKIIDMNNNMKEIKYEDTESYKIYKDFLSNPYGMQNILFEE